jgi:hypothetical protein
VEQPLNDEHLLVQISPDTVQCADKEIVTRSYKPSLYTHPTFVDEIQFTPSGDMRLALRLSDGTTPPLKAHICSRCRNLLVWSCMGKLQRRIDSLQHQVENLAERVEVLEGNT